MADETKNPEDGPEPPKIKLNIGNGGAAKTAPATPSRMSVTPASAKKSETARIDLASAKAPAELSEAEKADLFKRATMRIDQPPPRKSDTQKVKPDTQRIDAASIKPAPTMTEAEKADLFKRATMRIDQPPPRKSDTQKVKPDTQRIDAASIKPAPTMTEAEKADLFKRATMRIDQPSSTLKSETQKIKPDTQRIDLDAAKQTTMRVELDAQEQKRQTTRLGIPSDISARETMKIQTSRIAPGEAEDVFKRSTIPMGIPTPPPPSATRPPTVQGPRPKTMQVKRQVEAESSIVPSPAAAEAAMEAKKSETARIDLPADVGERPPTRPKTIRIKRPDGTTGRKALTISRLAEQEDISVVPEAAAMAKDDSPGIVFSLLAAAAVLAVIVLTYVLAAQTIALDLPFPGRI